MRSDSALPSQSPVLVSPIETYYWALEAHSGTFRTAVVCRLDGCIEADLLAAALGKLQQRHPKLRAVIRLGTDGRLRYYFPDNPSPIPFEIVEFDRDEPLWREETRRLLYRDLPPAGPLAAVMILRNRVRRRCELLITVTHAIADGTAAVMLLDELLTEYAIAEAGGDRTPRPTLQAVSPSHARSIGTWRNELSLFRRFLGLVYKRMRSPQTPLPEDLDVPPFSQWVHWVLSKQDTVRLVRRCRKEGTSVNAALMAAAFCAVTDCLKRSDGMFTWLVPFSVRDLLKGDSSPVNGDDLGCFACNMIGRICVSQGTPLWQVAKRVHDEIRRFQQLGGPSFGYNACSLLYAMFVGLARLSGDPPPRHLISAEERKTILATNYGVIRVRDQYGSLRPIACTVNYRNDRHGSPLTLETLVMGQQLNIGFAGDRLAPAFWEEVCAALRHRIGVAASS